MREITGTEAEILVTQLEDTSAMLAVLLEDVYDIANEEVKNRICQEIGKINSAIRTVKAGV